MKIPDNFLKNKNVLVGVTGSIAIYKSLELIRLFVKAGADVRVVISESAKKFITPLTFETLSGNAVLHNESENWHSDHNHIGISKWAELFIIAPASANTLNKLSNGIADNLLLQTALAYPKKKLIAPSANTNMLKNHITQASMKMLQLTNYELIETQTKLLACNTEGDGAMAEPLELFYVSLRELMRDEFWENRRVIVTGGGTQEKIDDVRYLSNFSSGKMASSLAMALYFKGADVCYIGTKFPFTFANSICTISVKSAKELHRYTQDSIEVSKQGFVTKPTLTNGSKPELIKKTPYLFMTAAVSDYMAKEPRGGKLKSAKIGHEWSIKLQENIDVLASLNRDKVKTIGFKAEMDAQNAQKYATAMLVEKSLDAVCLNRLQDSSSFGSDNNQIDFITKKQLKKLPLRDKLTLSMQIVKEAEKL